VKAGAERPHQNVEPFPSTRKHFPPALWLVAEDETACNKPNDAHLLSSQRNSFLGENVKTLHNAG